MTPHDLLPKSTKQLQGLLRDGHSFDPSDLAGSRYRGISLGLPGWVEALSWKKFAKCFVSDENGTVQGWNQRIEQDGLDAPWTPMLTPEGEPRNFGFFEVLAAGQQRVPAGLEHACLVHYGRGRNRHLDPTRLLRDPLISLVRGSSDLLLGWSYLELVSGLNLGTPSYFVLERDRPVEQLAGSPLVTKPEP